MLQAIAHVLPVALAMAISSVPIMATILILLSPNRRRAALPFLIGTVVGLALVVTLTTLGAQAIPTPRSDRQPDVALGIAELLVGVALVVFGVLRLRRSLRTAAYSMPGWLSTVSSFGPWSSLGVSLLLNVRPKAILLATAAGLNIRGAELAAGESAVVIGIYTLVAASTVAVPIVLTLAAPDRMTARLVRTREWMVRNNGSVTAVIVLLIGVVVFGYGLESVG
ncbi:GAP family protein [Agromyces sp. SYSU T00194]|uniref:GAP family protein n=1 Tax=Agromyces chitinivorans TaxID=3158560 RepID=UPI0033977824